MSQSNGNDDTILRVRDLTFSYEPSLPAVIHDVNCDVKQGSRVLVVGANGAGKTTLLRILAGRHMVARNSVLVLGRDAFHDTTLCSEVTYLGERWTQTGDVAVKDMVGLDHPSKAALKARMMRLMKVMDVDPNWRLYRLSDGQRRRVQICMALTKPVKIMLLDEITTDLDVVGRQNLLKFLYEESTERGVTVVYSTHIFDGIEPWATDVMYIREGTMVLCKPIKELLELSEARQKGSYAPLFTVVENWLRKEWEERNSTADKQMPKSALDMDVYDENNIDKQYFTDLSRSYNFPTPLPDASLMQQ